MAKNRTNIIRMVGWKNGINSNDDLTMYNIIEFNPYKAGRCIRWGMEILTKEPDWQEIKIIHVRTGRSKIVKRNNRMKFNKKNVRKWMRDNVSDYDNCTSLSEAAANEFGMADTGGPLDDETHWIWELAVNVKKDMGYEDHCQELRKQGQWT